MKVCLMEEIAKRLGVNISDLRFLFASSEFKDTLHRVNKEDYTLEEWKELYHYVFNKEKDFIDKDAVISALLYQKNN